MTNLPDRICNRGLWDLTVPGIRFDENGICNYSEMFDMYVKMYPRGEVGLNAWNNWVKKIKKEGQNKKYDCIIGVSGGTDSSYLLYLAKFYNLRPLAVNLDNGWSTDIAVKNIKKVTSALNIDLETYVINYEEVKAVLRAYLKASLPWADTATDMAIGAALYKVANREKIKYIFNGSDFRSEGKQPTEWTYSDARQLLYLVRKFEGIKLKTFPYNTLVRFAYLGIIKGIKMIRPYNYLEYQKKEAQKFLIKNYGWEYYGGHHHENLFTKFIIAYWLPKKFGIDKRKITLSAQILSGEITRDQALKMLELPAYDPDIIERDKETVIKKLDLSAEEFKHIWDSPNKNYYDYPSYMPFIKHFSKFTKILLNHILPFKPSFFIEQDVRLNKKD
jgi:N-acetyl sugar amidotransferase